MVTKHVNIMLIEDDISEVARFKEVFKDRKDVSLVAVTNSSSVAIDEFKKYKPDGIIIDLELTDGEGSGFEFMEQINDMNLVTLPKMVVTTNVHSDAVYDYCHKNNVDFVYYKKQNNYSPEKIVNTLVMLSGYQNKKKKEDPNESNGSAVDNIKFKIEKELDKIGIGNHLQGRKYLRDAVVYILTFDEGRVSIAQHLASVYKRSPSTISRAMQNAIIHAWRVTPIEDLTKYYTARINYETGVPTPTEMIYYYADRIRKEMWV